MKLDELDKRILDELLYNSRRSFQQIANKLDVSTGTVLKRMKDLETAGIIKAYSAILDHKAFGYNITAVIEVTTAGDKIREVEQSMLNNPNVCAIYDITGYTDAMIIAKFRSIHELDEFVKELLKSKYIERTNTHIVLNTIKEDFRLSP